MQQNINLYHNFEPTDSIKLPFIQVFAINKLLVTVLVIFSAGIILYDYMNKQKISVLLKEKESLTSNLTTQMSKISTPAQIKQYELSLKIQEKELIGRQKMVTTLKKLQGERSKGFSRYLTALSNHSQEGIWLNQFKFSQGGNEIFLQGYTKKSEFVPQLLKRLGTNSEFENRRFKVFKLEFDKEVENLKFILNSEKTNENN